MAQRWGLERRIFITQKYHSLGEEAESPKRMSRKWRDLKTKFPFACYIVKHYRMKIFLLLFLVLAIVGLTAWYKLGVALTKPENAMAITSFYDFKMTTLDNGGIIDFQEFKGKKVILINVASECGYTPQYVDWEAFHKQYGEKVVVLGFPANNFGGQEPGTNAEIGAFCQKNYGVTFQLFEKISVKGSDQHPLYQWLSQKGKNGWNDQAPTWNFCKYVVNEQGELTNFFPSGVKPEDEAFKKAVGM